MSSTATCRRTQRRHATKGTEGAVVEMTYPQPTGPSHEFPLVDISISGLSFIFEDELPGIDSGDALSDVVVRLADCDIRGELVVMHVTAHSETRRVCGALFYAASDTDLLKWRSAIAGMQAVS
jgi:hypothetical protein